MLLGSIVGYIRFMTDIVWRLLSTSSAYSGGKNAEQGAAVDFCLIPASVGSDCYNKVWETGGLRSNWNLAEMCCSTHTSTITSCRLSLLFLIGPKCGMKLWKSIVRVISIFKATDKVFSQSEHENVKKEITRAWEHPKKLLQTLKRL